MKWPDSPDHAVKVASFIDVSLKQKNNQLVITMMHNSYMILKMMFWISFCLDFFVTNFTMLIDDLLSLATMVWIFNS
jgi:hypothetical protein